MSIHFNYIFFMTKNILFNFLLLFYYTPMISMKKKTDYSERFFKVITLACVEYVLAK